MNPETKAVGDVSIGRYCAIAEQNLFKEGNHLVSKPSMQMGFYDDVFDENLESTSHGPIELENDVWLGARAIVLSGVTIGSGAIVGAGSVVTKDVEPYSVVAGAPAERIKWRFPEEVRERLLELAWWDWDEETMRDYEDFFTREIETADDVPDPA
ncbi:MAG: CatB-related O-acetyltransferase [Haloferacaceae archaeon]